MAVTIATSRAKDRSRSTPEHLSYSLDRLDELLVRVDAAGIPVTMELDGDPHELADGVQLTVFRVAQEALTNTLKHAGRPTCAHLALSCRPEQVELEVTDTGGERAVAVAAAKRLQPDVVLMDVRMPEMDGVKATQLIIDSQSSTRIIILTTFDLDEYVYAALRAGFLLKDTRQATCSQAYAQSPAEMPW